MKKFNFNSKYMRISLYAIFVLLFYIILDRSIENLTNITAWLENSISGITTLMQPFIYGLFIAYFLNSPMKNIEQRIFGKIKFLEERKSTKRVLAIASTYLILISCIYWAIAYLLPEIAKTFSTLLTNLQALNANISNIKLPFTNQEFIDIFEFVNSTFGINLALTDIINVILQPILSLLDSTPQIINTLFTETINFASLLMNFILGLVIGFYMLCEKEHFGKMISKFLYVVLPPKAVEKIIEVAKDSNKIFENFFLGKTIDSLIIGALFFITCQLTIKPNFILILSVIIGITNMIPYFGPFIGAVPVLFIVVINSPMDAVWVGVIILALQQLDGIVIGPKILGESTGLKPMGVIFAILVGGAIAGPLGMFLGVPIFAVIRNIGVVVINKMYNDKMEKNKQLELKK